jgi:hypothetical protein
MQQEYTRHEFSEYTQLFFFSAKLRELILLYDFRPALYDFRLGFHFK